METDEGLVTDQAPYDMDLTPAEEDAVWAQFAAAQLLKQYGEADEIYDQGGELQGEGSDGH